MNITKRILLLVALACFASHYASAQTAAIKTRIVVGEQRAPWELLWGPDDKLWMTELRGGVSTIDPATGAKTILLDSLPDLSFLHEDGLLGMALHPLFSESPYAYIGYTYFQNDNVRLKVVRYRYNGTKLVEPTILIGNILGGTIHNGCRVVFGPDGMLYITSGDAGNPANAQNIASHNGKVLRIAPDGSIPEDNPFPGSPVWTWGHRNSQGLAFGPTGILYATEHGVQTDDEVNIIMKGRNYGWPNVEGLCNFPAELAFCEDSNVVEPIGAPYTPTLALGDIAYYASDLIPAWTGKILMTAMKQQATLIAITLSEDKSRIVSEERYFQGVYGRLRALCVAPDGRVFFGSSNHDAYGRDGEGQPGSDWIIEITPATSAVDGEGVAEDDAADRDVATSVSEINISDVLGRHMLTVHDVLPRVAHNTQALTLSAGVYVATTVVGNKMYVARFVR